MNHWTEVQLVRPQPRMKRSVLTAFVTTVDVSSPGRDASHYSWTGRDCDVLLFIVMMRLLEIEHSEGPFTIALVVGLATHIDGFIITTAIPERRHDVHTIANVFEKPCRDLWNAIYGNRNTNIEYQLRGRLRSH